MIVPANNGHYVENIGECDIEMLEIFKSPMWVLPPDYFFYFMMLTTEGVIRSLEEFSLQQWMAHTPGYLVNIGDDFIASLDKGRTPIRDEKVFSQLVPSSKAA